MTQETPASACWLCGAIADRASAVTAAEAPPVEPHAKPGDAAMCIQCGVWSIYGENLTRREPTAAELESIEESAVGRMTSKAWRRMQEARSTRDHQ